MSNLPPLPSAMQNAVPAPTATGAVSAEQLAQPVELTIKLDGPGFKAREALPPADAAEREAYAKKLVYDAGFNALWIASFAKNLQLDTGLLDSVLDKTSNLDGKDVARLTRAATEGMRKVNRCVPKPPSPKFMAAYKAGKATADDIFRTISWLTSQIEEAVSQYQSMLTSFVKIVAELEEKYGVMVDTVVLSQQLAVNEDARTLTLIQDVALLEYALLALPDRIKTTQASVELSQDQIRKEVTRLTGLAELIRKAIMDLTPMIFGGNVSIERYLDLSNMAGSRALVLGVFLSAGIARWKSDVVQELLAMKLLTVGLAVEDLTEFMNQQAAHTSAAHVQAAQQTSDLLARWMTKAETMQQIVNDIETAHAILLKGADQLTDESRKTSSAVQDAKGKIDRSRDAFNDRMVAIIEESSK